jgi:hypothetical protein
LWVGLDTPSPQSGDNQPYYRRHIAVYSCRFSSASTAGTKPKECADYATR